MGNCWNIGVKAILLQLHIIIFHERIFDGLSLGAKEKGFGVDLEQKDEDSETKICLPQVRSLARPCHLPGQPFAAFA
ncbi:hypothetical protein MTR_8g446650 [Medicago truncatula]|uniref:Uncharacterized protein n=1 Tax=Medicago truncatula TaxID=3880 RepID=A0A072TQ20_MEDTR|nr:hypothetical protein MTR_8g446650 [Medicago truncatula]